MNGRPAGMSDDEDASSDGYDFSNRSEKIGWGNEATKEELEIENDPWKKHSTSSSEEKTNTINAVEMFRNYLVAGNVKKVQACLTSGISCDQTFAASFTSSGKRPVFVVCEEGHPAVLRLLLNNGASLHADDERFTPLMAVSASRSHGKQKDLLDCARLLLSSSDVNPNACQSQQLTALMFACKEGHDDVVAELLKVSNVDAQDSQRWTSLMYAVNAGHGHIVRRLLEAGARTDLASVDGARPSDLAASNGNAMLQSIIDHFAGNNECGINLSKGGRTAACVKYSELDNILLGLEAGEVMPNFKAHNVDLQEFLQLGETDLVEIGVHQVGLRKKMMDAIAEMHKRQWEKSSLPRITPKEKQKGIYLTAPDGVMMVANVSRHLKFLCANLDFLRRHLVEKPEMLLIGNDIANASDLYKYTQEAQDHLHKFQRQLCQLDGIVSTCARDDRYVPSGKICSAQRGSCLVYGATIAGIVGLVSVFSYFFQSSGK